MKCKECESCIKGRFPSKPNEYVCVEVREPFVIEDIYSECTEYPHKRESHLADKIIQNIDKRIKQIIGNEDKDMSGIFFEGVKLHVMAIGNFIEYIQNNYDNSKPIYISDLTRDISANYFKQWGELKEREVDELLLSRQKASFEFVDGKVKYSSKLISGTVDTIEKAINDIREADYNRMIDKFNKIGCTSFMCSPEEIKELLNLDK